MAGPIMRRLAAPLLASLTLVLALPAPPTPAQEPAAVRLTLVSQTPWCSTKNPALSIRVRAENLGDRPIEDLSLGVTLFGPVFTRTDYESSLRSDPASGVIAAETLPQAGSLAPGETRELAVDLDLSSVGGLSSTSSLVYPLKIDLRSGFVSLAAIRTPVIFLVRRPLFPLNLTWTFVLDAPIELGPDGVFRSTALERSVSPGGRLAAEVGALATLVARSPATPVDVVVSPMLLTQLSRMRNGYTVIDGGTEREVGEGEGGAAAAASVLSALERIAGSPSVELSALPFSSPSLPALAASGLGRDLDVQLERGRAAVQTLLGHPPVAGVLRPPGSDLDQASLSALPALGVHLLLLDADTVPPPAQQLGFAPPPIATLPAGEVQVDAVVSDPSVAALLDTVAAEGDAALGAQSVLGELAQIWLERPSVERGIALVVPGSLAVPPGFYARFVGGIAGAPWLRTRSATALASLAPTFQLPLPGALAPTTAGAFPTGYVEALKQARRLVGIYRSMIVGDPAPADRLDTLLLMAESGQFVSDLLHGQAFISAARSEVGAVFAALRPPAGQVITLTSSAGNGIPVRIANANPEPLRIVVRLVSNHLRTTPQSSLVVPANVTQTVSFNVRLNTTGRFPVDVQIVSPSGRVVSETTLIVRSTAFNRIALVITIGAAMLALLVWARRFLPRRTC